MSAPRGVARADANGSLEVFTFDGFGRLAGRQLTPPEVTGVTTQPCSLPALSTGTFDFAGKPVVPVATITWGTAPDGSCYKQTDALQQWPTSSPPTTRWAREYRDGHGRVILRASQGDPANGDVIRSVRLSSSGKVDARSLPFFGSADTCLASGPGTTPEFAYSYDDHGRLSTISFPVGPDGTSTCVKSLSYAQQAQTVVYARGDAAEFTEVWQFGYARSRARLLSIAGPDGSNARTFRYDRFGRLVGLTDAKTSSNPEGVATSITYDSFGRRTALANPDTGVMTSIYGANGRIQTQTTSAGTFSYGYDPLGRLTTVDRPQSGRGADVATVSYGYDAGTSNGLGRLTQVTTTTVDGIEQDQTTYGYDPSGNRIRTSTAYGGATYVQTSVFDPVKRAVEITCPDETQVIREFSYGNLVEVSVAGDPAASVAVGSADHTAAGSPLRTLHGNGVVTTRGWSPGSWLQSQQVVAGDQTGLLDLSYTWSSLGQVLSIDGDAEASFDYQTLRLRNAEGAAPQTYGYDDSGNLTSIGTMDVAYDAHRAVSGSGSDNGSDFTASYDGGGNLRSLTSGGQTWTYVYDVANQLVEVSLDDEVVQQNDYDPGGRRIAQRIYRSGALAEEHRYLDPRFEVVMASASTTTNVYLEGPAVWTGVRSSDETLVQRTYYHPSHNGSTLLATDDDGSVVAAISYLPFGEPVVSGTGSARVRPLLTGQEYDESTGLYYFGARFYHPSLGRFVQADPQLGSQTTRQDATNRYAYVGNDPINYADPSGHIMWLVFYLVSMQRAEALGQTADTMADTYSAYLNLMNISSNLVNTLIPNGNLAFSAMNVEGEMFATAARVTGPYENLWGAYARVAGAQTRIGNAVGDYWNTVRDAANDLGVDAVLPGGPAEQMALSPLRNLIGTFNDSIASSQATLDRAGLDTINTLAAEDPEFLEVLATDPNAIESMTTILSGMTEGVAENAIATAVAGAPDAAIEALAVLFLL